MTTGQQCSWGQCGILVCPDDVMIEDLNVPPELPDVHHTHENTSAVVTLSDLTAVRTQNVL